MLYIFHGPDDYTKKLHVSRMARGLALPVVLFMEGDVIPDAGSLTGGDLFGGDKIFIFRNLLQRVATHDFNAFKQTRNHVLFLEDSLDKRLALSKQLLKDSEVVTQEFLVPEGWELVQWIVSRSKERGGDMEQEAAEVLLKQLGMEQEGIKFGPDVKVSLWQLDSEINKLITYANSKPVTPQMVQSLVSEGAEVQGFDIINALAEKNKGKVFSLCERFFKETTGSDEKAKLILLNSLLADQFRSILIVQGILEFRMPESEALTATGWKSGRLFIMKKIASKFEQKKVIETLHKLESLDLELKSTTTPGHVLIDLILAQVV